MPRLKSMTLKRRKANAMSDTKKNYLRFDVAQRFEHLLLIISFTLLALTGLPQKYSLEPIPPRTTGIKNL